MRDFLDPSESATALAIKERVNDYLQMHTKSAKKAVEQMCAWMRESGIPYEMTIVEGGWEVPRPRCRLLVVMESGVPERLTVAIPDSSPTTRQPNARQEDGTP